VVREIIIVLSALFMAAGCSEDGHSLTIDLRTDYLPGAEFTRVETTVEIGGESLDAIPSGAAATDDFVAGERIAEFEGLAPGNAQVRVTLRDPAGELLATRLSRLDLDTGTGLLVVISRNCGGVACPGPMDAPDATECLSGQCVPPTCSSDDPTSCGSVACEVGTTCTSAVPCVEAICEGIACLTVPRDARCEAGQRCDIARGCVDVVVSDSGPMDSGPMDSGPMDSGLVDTAADTGSDAGLDPSLVAWWPCESLTGGVLPDVTGNGHDGLCASGLCPGIVAGRVGMACDFESEFPDTIRVPHHDDFNTMSGFSVAVWIMPRDFDYRSVFAKPVGTGDNNSYQLEFRVGPPPELLFTATPDDMAGGFLRHSDASLSSGWHHIAGTWDGTTKRLYLDGTEVATGAQTTMVFDTHDVLIGYDNNFGSPVYFYDGLMDDLRFYDRALSPGEVAALASAP
jgi:hypothetical protein